MTFDQWFKASDLPPSCKPLVKRAWLSAKLDLRNTVLNVQISHTCASVGGVCPLGLRDVLIE